MIADKIEEHNWPNVEQQYRLSSPYNFSVIDNFLTKANLKILRRQLVTHWGWRRKNWTSNYLHNRTPDIPGLLELGRKLESLLPLQRDEKLVDFWALMFHRNLSGSPHSDNASIAFTLWLTEECFNNDPDSGGLTLFDVKRDDRQRPHEHLVSRWSSQYLAENTCGASTYIPYKENRAVIFDARTFHVTESPNFDVSKPDGYRINLTYAFDQPKSYKKRLAEYRS